MKTFLQLREATNRTKRNPTRDFLRRYPVSDAEMAKPVKKPEKKKPDQGMAEATVDIADIEKKKNISPKDKKTLGKIHDLMARERALQQAKPVKKPEKQKPEQGVAEAAFKDPSPMMKDSIKQDRIRSLNNLIAIAKVKGVHHKVKEYESELKKLKETTEVTEAVPFSYGFVKPPRKGSVAYNALMKRKEQDRKRVKEIEAIGTKNHHVGIAKVTKVTKEEIEDVNNLEEGSKSETEGMVSYIHHIIKNHVYPRAGDKETYMKHVAKEMPSIVKSNPKLFRRAHSIAYDRFFHVDKNNNDYDHTDHSMRQGEMGHRKGMSEAKDEMYKYIDQSGGHQIKGKSGTYVGYTHSATKGKGANILKHNQTKKYYAAGGSSTAFTQKTTLHDTPEDAARAYHKGKLAEEKNMNESWKKKLAGAALATTMAVGAHARVSADHKDDPNINRLTGKPHVTQSDEKPTELQSRELESADKVERHGGFNHGDKVTIHHNGKSYEGHFMDKDGPRMRGGKTIKVHHAQVGIRGLGHYEAQIHPSGHAVIYK